MSRQEDFIEAGIQYRLKRGRPMCIAGSNLADVERDFNRVIPYEEGAEHGYQYALQHPQWIPVEDELPKVGASVLFVHPDESEPMEGYMTRTKTWWSEKYRCSFEKVTHWMLMPKPPRKEE